MKHDHAAEVHINLPTQDLEDLVEKVTENAISVIAFYMLADSARHILKFILK